MEGMFKAAHPELKVRKVRKLNESEETREPLDYRKAVEIIKQAIERLDRSVIRPNLKDDKIEKDEYGTDTFVFYGGLNGGGSYDKWTGYFEQLTNFVADVTRDYDIWLIKLENDCIDDVFYAEFGIQNIAS